MGKRIKINNVNDQGQTPLKTLLNIDEPLTRIKGSTVRHYVTDALGSVIALTDDSGVIKTTYTYDPFGNVTISGEASDNPFQYTGREYDGTGLYYYRARYYSPELQRFISEDPIGLAGGINYFSYAKNNPVNRFDPLGLYESPTGDTPPPDAVSQGPGVPTSYPWTGWTVNPNGLACSIVCNLGNGLVSTSLVLSGVGSSITVPVWIAGRGFCSYICPPPITKCEKKR